jgi:hypothetical protein
MKMFLFKKAIDRQSLMLKNPLIDLQRMPQATSSLFHVQLFLPDGVHDPRILSLPNDVKGDSKIVSLLHTQQQRL